MKLTPPQVGYIERVGRWWDSIYGSKMAGRILGLLMICDPPHLSAQEMVETLGASTGSISTQTRLLVSLNLVETTSFLGDRTNYFQLRPNVWVQMMWAEQARILGMRELATNVEGVLPEQRPERLTELALMTEFLVEEWPKMMSRMSEHLKSRESDGGYAEPNQGAV